MPDDAEVCCADCGLLAMRSKRTQELVGVSNEVRLHGKLPSEKAGSVGEFPIMIDTHEKPECSVGAYDLRAEYDKIGFVATFKKPRVCPQHIRWIPALSPKEHHQMDIVAQVRAETLKWKQQVEALNETRHQEMRRDLDRHNSRSTAVAIVSATAALLSVLAALAAWAATR